MSFDKTGATEVHPVWPKRDCEAVDCTDQFTPSGPWGERRCKRCRKEKRPYKDVAPF